MIRRRILRRFAFGALALLLPPLGYALAALLGALIPANASFREPAEGVTIFVLDNGVHADVAVPVVAAGVDWRRLLGDQGGAAYLSFGWGHREFYLETPTWADLTARTAIRALTGFGGTLMHVDSLDPLAVTPDQRAIRLTPAQYHRLARFIVAGFRLEQGRPSPPIPGYHGSDRFYEARGRYHLFRTSNVWTGAALREAGVRVGIWTPFSKSVMTSLPRAATPPGGG